VTAYITATGIRYHEDPDCPQLHGAEAIPTDDLDEIDRNLRPCSTCGNAEPTLAQQSEGWRRKE